MRGANARRLKLPLLCTMREFKVHRAVNIRLDGPFAVAKKRGYTRESKAAHFLDAMGSSAGRLAGAAGVESSFGGGAVGGRLVQHCTPAWRSAAAVWPVFLKQCQCLTGSVDALMPSGALGIRAQGGDLDGGVAN